jgi:hypothetical protein
MMQQSLQTRSPLPDEAPPRWIGAAALRRLLPPAVVVDAVESALKRANAPAGASHALASDVAGGVFHVKAAAMTAPRAVYLAKVTRMSRAIPREGCRRSRASPRCSTPRTAACWRSSTRPS